MKPPEKRSTDILFLNPPYSEDVYELDQVVAVKPPLGLGYIAAALENQGVDVRILDANAERLSSEQTVDRIIANPAKILGITGVTTIMPIVFKIAGLVKARSDKIIIAGGPHVTFTSERTLRECRSIDIVVRNEGEETMAELSPLLLGGKDISRVAGITFRGRERIVHNPDRGLIKDISAIAFPARHLLPLEKYHPSSLFNSGVKGKEYATIISARGCPNRCIFCSSSHFWKKLRQRSPEDVIAEIKYLLETYNVKQIDFLDDTVTFPVSRLTEICDLMIRNKLRVKWSCYSRADTLTEEAVKKMKRSGCFAVQFGIESGNRQILKTIRKNITLEQVRNSVRLVKRYGLKVMGDFMIGLPGDTEETVQETIEFAQELGLNLAFFSVTTPFPGTKLYADAINAGVFEAEHNWDDMTLHKSTSFRTKDLTAQNLKELYDKAIKGFYLRPRYWAETLKWIVRNPYDLKNYTALGMAFLHNRFGKH